MQCLLRAVEILHKGFEPAVVMERHGFRLGPAQIGQHQGDAAVQEGEFAQPVLQGREVELGLRERLRARQKRDLGAGHDLARDPGGSVGAGPTSASGASGTPSWKRMNHSEPRAEDPQIEARRQRVDDRHADPVQPARDLVRVLVEFAAGMQLGHDDLGRRDAFLLVDADRDAAAVIGHGARAVGVQRHRDRVAIAFERLVDRVVDDLVDHVVQAGAVIGVADIHARPLAHRVEAVQHLDRVLVVGPRRCLRAAGPYVRERLRLPFGSRCLVRNSVLGQ